MPNSMPRPRARASVAPAALAAIRAEITRGDPAARAQAIDALAALGDARGLVAALGAHDAYVRRTAVKGLTAEPGMWTTWRIGRLRHDPDPLVRGAVAEALTRRPSRLARYLLGRILAADPTMQVRLLAVMGLAEHADLPGIDARLREAMTHDTEPQVRAMARVLLRRRNERRDGRMR